MKILDTELEFEFNDADDMVKLENAVDKTKTTLDNMQTEGKKTSEVIRSCCQAIFDCFNDIFGEGTSTKVFGNKTNMKVCIEAFKDLADARLKQDQEFASDLADIEKTYGTNRATRGAKK